MGSDIQHEAYNRLYSLKATHARPHARTNSVPTHACSCSSRSWATTRTGRLHAQPPAASVRLNRLGCPCSIASHQNVRAYAVWFRLTPAWNPDLTGLAPRRAPTSAFGPDLDPKTPTSQGLAPRRALDHSLGPRPKRECAQTRSALWVLASLAEEERFAEKGWRVLGAIAD